MSRITPVARVLTEPCLILGVEKPFAIVNFTLAMVVGGELHLWAFLLVNLAVHMTLRRITQRDPFARQIYIRYNLQADRYAPWIHSRLFQGKRPFSDSRGVLC